MTIATKLSKISLLALVDRVGTKTKRSVTYPPTGSLGEEYLDKLVRVFVENLPDDESDIQMHVKNRNDEKWGVDTSSVIPYKAANTAVSLGLLLWEYKPESTVYTTAGLILIHQLKTYTSAVVEVLCEEAVKAYEEGPEMAYIAIVNVPGYLPMAEEPAEFQTIAEAWAYLADEREREEDNVVESFTGAPLPEAEGDSDTLKELRRRAAEVEDSKCDAVYGPTPGYDGNHDLGLVYSVTAARQD